MNSICKECGAVDSIVGNGDCDGCSECYTIDADVLYVEDFECGSDLVVDEYGYIYIENEELDGPIACEWVPNIKE